MTRTSRHVYKLRGRTESFSLPPYIWVSFRIGEKLFGWLWNSCLAARPPHLCHRRIHGCCETRAAGGQAVLSALWRSAFVSCLGETVGILCNRDQPYEHHDILTCSVNSTGVEGTCNPSQLGNSRPLFMKTQTFRDKTGRQEWQSQRALIPSLRAVSKLFDCKLQVPVTVHREQSVRREETNKMQRSDVYYQLLSQHVSGIIMAIFRRTKALLLHLVCCSGSAGCGW